jgi:cytochrome c biogenesis protein CcmG, thiol:disulfide interchange protein DsbE
MSDETKPKVDRVTVVFATVLLAGAALLGWQEVRGGIVPEGSLAPPLVAETLEGGSLSLASLQGKVVVVNFWATWCPPCREEIPSLLRTVKALEAEGVVLVAVNTDDVPGQKDVVRRFVRQFPQLGPSVVLGRPELGAAYHVRALPSVFIIDRTGRVVSSHQGQATEAQLEGWLAEALGQ